MGICSLAQALEVVLLWRSLVAVTEFEKKLQSTNALHQTSPPGNRASRVPACFVRNGGQNKKINRWYI